MKQNKETLKEYFETGDKPTQEQYSDLIDSYIDSQQEAGEDNRRFVIDETGEVAVASALEIPEYTLSEIQNNKLSLLKDGEVVKEVDFNNLISSGSLDANLPSDFYEDGTYEPKLYSLNGAENISTSNIFTKYVRIGNMVHFKIIVRNVSGGVYSIDLPFDEESNGMNNIRPVYFFAAKYQDNVASPKDYFMSLTSKKMYFSYGDSSVFKSIDFDSEGNGNGAFQISGSYQTNVYTL